MSDDTAPLAGICVVDFSELLPGPFLTQSLAELGAEVVKVERPGMGDPARSMSPGLFGAVNRGKHSMVLDLKSEAGRQRAMGLADVSDVLVEGFRPGVMTRLGLGYEKLAARNPGLVYLSLTGYGQTGPLAQLPGHDLNYLAQAGMLSLESDPQAEPEHTFGVPVADLCGSIYALSAILAALLQRTRSGRGQHLDLSMTDCVAHWLNARRGPMSRSTAISLDEQHRPSLRRPAYGVFRCRDGAITICALENHFWYSLVRILGLKRFADDKFAATSHRVTAAREINDAVAEAIAPMSCDEALKLLLDADIPAAPVLSLDEAARSAHFRARGLMSETDAGPLTVFPVRMAGIEQTPASAPGFNDEDFPAKG